MYKSNNIKINNINNNNVLKILIILNITDARYASAI